MLYAIVTSAIGFICWIAVLCDKDAGIPSLRK